MMKMIFLFAFVALSIVSCERQENDPLPQQPADLNLSVSTESMLQADNAFGFDIFRKVVENSSTANEFVSPTSIAMALAMTYNGARGETKRAMEEALYKQGLTTEEINSGYKSLLNALKSIDERVILEIANSIWYDDQKITVLQSFIDENQDVYNAEIQKLDFNSAAAVDIINGWVEDKTHGKIPTIIETIPEDMVMYLINAIYFNGKWTRKFDKAQTADGLFYPQEGSGVTVKFMKQTQKFQAAEKELFRIVELPYGRGNFAMVVVLPEADKTIQDIMPLLTSENWNAWMSDMHEKSVDLQLPRFTYSYKNKLNDELSGLGMGVAFSDMADFSGITGEPNLRISEVIHKSFVKVDEEGTEAAAVTSVGIELTSVPDNVLFHVNRPFIFAIREKTTGTVLFLGKVSNPLVTENEQ